ncbi:hypothetical protein TNCV_1177251, partial [Trichonephila clavipes]
MCLRTVLDLKVEERHGGFSSGRFFICEIFATLEALRLDFGFNIVGLRVGGEARRMTTLIGRSFEHEALKFNPSLFEPVAEAPVFELVS